MKAEVNQGLSLDRSKNARSISDYNVSSNHSIFGAPWKTYAPVQNDSRHFLEMMDTYNHRPYLVALTCLVESPMKLFVYN